VHSKLALKQMYPLVVTPYFGTLTKEYVASQKRKHKLDEGIHSRELYYKHIHTDLHEGLHKMEISGNFVIYLYIYIYMYVSMQLLGIENPGFPSSTVQ